MTEQMRFIARIIEARDRNANSPALGDRDSAASRPSLIFLLATAALAAATIGPAADLVAQAPRVTMSSEDPIRCSSTSDYPATVGEAIDAMRSLSMRFSWDHGSPESVLRGAILDRLRCAREGAVEPLASALSDTEIRMRRNTALVLIYLSYSPEAVDTREALPALLEATEDDDPKVRGWSALALGNMGPAAADAIPVLLKLLTDPYEGARNNSAIALGQIGIAAEGVLPALQEATNTGDEHLPRFASIAIDRILETSEVNRSDP